MNAIDALLGGLAALLAAVLLWQAQTLLEPDAVPLAPAEVTAVPLPPPAEAFGLPALAAFQEIVERPLFVPDRRPQPAAATPLPLPLPAAPSDLRLMGIVQTQGRPRAVLRGPDGRTTTAGAGETVGRATILSVGAETVVVVDPGGRRELTLPSPGSGAPSPPGLGTAETVNGLMTIPRIP